MNSRFISKIVAGALCAFALNSHAQNGTWTNLNGGSWASPANWSGGTIANGTDSTADFSTLTLGAAPTVTLDGAQTIGNLVFGDAGNIYGWTLNTGSGDPLTLAVSSGSPTITVNGQTSTIGLVLAGTAGMTKAGAGTLVLANNANIYTGGTTVSAGTLQIGLGAAPIGTISGPYSIGGSGTLELFRTATTINTTYTGSGILWLQGSTAAIDWGQPALNSSFTGIIVIGQGRLYSNAASTGLGSTTGLRVNSGGEYGVFNITGPYNLPISIAGIGSTIDATPYGAIRLDAGATWSGNITLTANARIANHNETAADTISGTISGPNELELYSDDGNATGKQMNLTPSAQNTYGSTKISNTIIVNANNAFALSTGALTMNGGTLKTLGNNFSFANLSGASGQIQNGHASAAAVITVGSDNTSTTYSGTLVNGSTAALGLTKTGTGTLTLIGANTYTGPTLVSAGELVVSSAQTGTNAITVNDGAALSVTVSGASQLSPAMLTLGSTSGPTTNEFGGLASTTVAPINTTNLVLNGTTTISILNGFFVVGQTYPLISFTTLTGTGGFVLGAVPAGMTGATVITNGSTIALSVTGYTAQTNLWTGAISGNWDKSTANWTTNGVAAIYSDYNVALFDDTATGPTNVTNTVTVLPEAVIVNNANLNYTISGSAITGGGTLTKLGTGTLTLSGNSTYTGGTVVDAGTVNLAKPNNGENSALGKGLVTVNTNGTITVSANNALGSGGAQTPSLSVNGGTINAGANDIQFINLTMNGGMLTGNDGTSFSWFSYGDVTINSNATGASVGGNSPWYLRNPNHNTIFNVAAGGSGNDLTVTNALVSDQGTKGLVKTGNGVMTIFGTCTYAGTTTVSNGTLVVNGTLAAGSAVTVCSNATLTGAGTIGGAVTVQSGGTLGGTGTLNGATTIQNGGILTVGSTPTNTGTLYINNSLSLSGVTVMKISKNGGYPTSDQVAGLNGATFGGTLMVTNITSDGNLLVVNDMFYLFSKSSGNYLGGFTNIVLPSPPSGLNWDLSQLLVNGTIALVQSVSPPVFNPPGGGYVGAPTVTITSDSGSTIFYTTDGSYPTTLSPNAPSPVNIAVPANTDGFILQAYATNAGYADSVVVGATYYTVPVPTWIQPYGGSWSGTYNWSNNVIANGSGVTADLSELTLSFDMYITMDSSSTVGGMIFGDVGNAYNTYIEAGGGTLTLDAGTNPSVITVSNQTAEIDAPLAGANGLIKTGAGKLTLAGANTYTGATTVSNGVVQFGNGSVNSTFGSSAYLAPNTTLGFDYATASAPVWTNIVGMGTLELNSAQAVNGSANWGGPSLSTNFTGTLQLDNGRVNATPSSLGGATAVVVNSGAQFLAYTGANNNGSNYLFSQNFSINGMGWGESGQNYGALRVSQMNAVFTGNIVLTGDAGLFTQNANNGTLIVRGAIPGNYNVVFAALSNPITLTGTNTYTGTTTISAGTLQIGDGTTDGSISASSDIINNATLVFNLAGAQDCTNEIDGTGALIKTGNGTLTLSAMNTYGGTTTISNGTLAVNGSLENGGAVIVNAGAVLDGSGTIDGAVTLNSGGIIQGGDATGSNTLTAAALLALGANSTDVTASRFTVAAGGMVAATAGLNVNGTNIVNILDASLPVGTNTLFTYSGGAVGGGSGFGGFRLGTLPPGVTAQLLDTGSAVQLAVTSVVAVNPNPTNLTAVVSGDTLMLSWPADHTGWRLLVQTNNLAAGISSNTNDWMTVPGSTGINQTNLTIDPAKPAEFYRLVYP